MPLQNRIVVVSRLSVVHDREVYVIQLICIKK